MSERQKFGKLDFGSVLFILMENWQHLEINWLLEEFIGLLDWLIDTMVDLLLGFIFQFIFDWLILDLI